MAMQYIQQHGGLIVYLQQEGRGIGLANKVAAYAVQDELGLDTVDANLHLGFPDDLRVYDVVPLILRQLNIDRIHLLTNNPRKVQELQNLGITIDATIPMVVPHSNEHNHKYLMTKRDRADHMNMEQLNINISSNNGGGSGSSTSRPLMAAPKVMAAPRRTLNGMPVLLSTANGVAAPPTDVTTTPTTTTTAVDGKATTTETTESYFNDDDDTAIINNNNNTSSDDDDEAPGVVKQADGYCFGKQTVVDAIAAMARGEMVVVVDDMDRENEGDFIMAADLCTAEKMAEIIRYSSGVICVAMEDDRLQTLQLPSMVQNNQDPKNTAFAVSVDATKAHGISTGISAADRAITVRWLANDQATAADFSRPGHLFPLKARPGGVLTRDGHTEATVDLARLAGRVPVGVLCEIVSEDHPTEMMRLPEMKRFAHDRGYVLTSIADLIQYRKETGQ
jgi:3,4-dihydroxy 2-butanone 4-phosphate synthase / GTP cyclohydrolase II